METNFSRKLLYSALLLLITGVLLLFSTCASTRTSAPADRNLPRGGIPIAAVLKELGLDFRISPTIGTCAVSMPDSDDLVFALGSRQVRVGDRTREISFPAVMVEGRFTVPRDGVDLLLTELYGARTGWSWNGRKFSLSGDRNRNARQHPDRKRRRAPVSFDVHTIIVDPGHGGKDPGGVGVEGILEKDITLQISRHLADELRRRLRKEVITTRDDDVYLSLEERGAVANRVEPEKNPLFVSVHANVSFNSRTAGFESYYLSLDPFGDKARDVASTENSVLGFEIDDHRSYLGDVLNQLVDVQYRKESHKLAEHIQDGLHGSLGNLSPNRKTKSAFFYVLKTAKMPAVLVEVGFITNQQEAANLVDPGYQVRIARGIAEGLERFLTEFRQTRGFTQELAD
jgi:N-acetylmuramoyl-L-alanine amidase